MTRMGTKADQLNVREMVFVQRYATNGQNGTAAARDAGYQGSDEVLAVTASRLLRRAKVQKALDGLIGKAIAKAERGAIADLAECLEFLTTVKRSKMADFFNDGGELDMERVRTAPEGLVRKIRMNSVTQRWGKNGENETTNTTHEIEAESALAATQALVRHYDALKAPEMFRTALTDALRDVADEGVVRLLARRLLTGSVNGNGHVVDVQAQVVK